MSIKTRLSRVESGMRKTAQQSGRILLVFTNEKAGTMEIHSGNQHLFSGTIEEGNEFIQNKDDLVVILPGADPRWCA
ncbi:MAG: hypothetical protein VR69_00195 [Peptococcaceae bacterium BRH_c4b]|nr:MAG: hypothetical protein VR69_00195 [Peptococcaceae bacterium BRH_c4b]